MTPATDTDLSLTAYRGGSHPTSDILILSASPRKNGNSDILCHQFIKGAQDAGHKTELISLYDKNLECCRACYACFKTGRCVIGDDMEEILNRMQQADVIVVATPTYFYTMNGKLKTVIDRFLPKWKEQKQCWKLIRRDTGPDIE